MMPYEIDFLESYDLDSITAELRRVAKVLGRPSVTGRELNRFGRVSAPTVVQKFGSMRNAHIAAGLAPTRAQRWSTEAMLKVLRDVWTLTLKDYGRRPRMADFRKYRVPVAAWSIADRFGTWTRALVAASQMSNAGEVPAELLKLETNPRPRKKLSPHTRFRVFQRDIYQCCICRISGVRLEVDHILPLSRGGSDTLDNLQTLCVPCNRGKRNSLQ
jgi:5-methylcytosine-specific restriction endonuclease McrA